jgi:hypothetical protein
LFVNHPLDAKENDEHALDFALHLSHWVWTCHSNTCVRPLLSSLNTSNHCQGLRQTFSKICTKSDAVPLSDPSWNCIKPDTRLQIKGHKNHHMHPAAWNLYTDSQDKLILSSAVSPRYNCCRDGSISPGNYGYPS